MPCQSRGDLLQCVSDCLERLLRLRALGTAALRHVGTAAAALPAKRRHRSLDEVDRVDLTREVVGDSHGHARTAVVECNQRSDAGADSLLHVINSGASVLRIKAFYNLAQQMLA